MTSSVDPRGDVTTRTRVSRDLRRLLEPMVGLEPEEVEEWIEPLGRLLDRHHSVVMELAREPRDEPERELAEWIRDLATVPAGSRLRFRIRRLVMSLGIIPRVTGAPVIERR